MNRRMFMFESPDGRMLEIAVDEVTGDVASVHWYSAHSRNEAGEWRRVAHWAHAQYVAPQKQCCMPHSSRDNLSCTKLVGHTGDHEWREGVYWLQWPPANCGARYANVACNLPTGHSGDYHEWSHTDGAYTRWPKQ